jgi:hypothetical protein
MFDTENIPSANVKKNNASRKMFRPSDPSETVRDESFANDSQPVNHFQVNGPNIPSLKTPLR